MIYFCVRKQERIDPGKVKHFCKSCWHKTSVCNMLRYFSNEGAFKRQIKKK